MFGKIKLFSVEKIKYKKKTQEYHLKKIWE